MLTTFLAGLAIATKTPADWIWGVTVDDTTDIVGIVDSLSHFSKRPTARVVFDPGAAPSFYSADVAAIHGVADVMGEPVDSEPANSAMTVDQYRARMVTYMDALRSNVDIWEIGNEVNGDWTGASLTVGRKVTAAYQEAKKRGYKTAITLFYSDLYKGTGRDMVLWSLLNLPSPVRSGVDYVFISYYPTSATAAMPNWTGIFGSLSRVFWRAKFGFGELGLATEGGDLSTDKAAKTKLLQNYYGMASPYPPRFVGGYFWWTFVQDAVPKSKTMWTTLSTFIK